MKNTKQKNSLKSLEESLSRDTEETDETADIIELMYVVSDYGSIIDHLYDAMDEIGVKMTGFFYDISKKGAKPKIYEYAYYHTAFHPLGRGFFFYLNRLKRISKICIEEVKKSGNNVLHGHMLFSDGIICREVQKVLGIDYIISVRNTDMNLWFLWRLPWIKKKGIDVALHAKKIIFINRPYANEFLTRMPIKIRRFIREKIETVPNGVDDFWHKNKGKAKRIDFGKSIRLISVGRIEKNKNQENVAKALNILRRRGINASYINVGAFNDKEITDRLMGKAGVELVSDKPKEELIKYYRNSDIYVMPSFTETFGLVYVEAMTQGLPIIYSKGQGFDGQFEDGEIGYRVDSNDPGDIADKVIRIVKNYSEMSERCLEQSDRYTWKNVAEMYCKTYSRPKNINDMLQK